MPEPDLYNHPAVRKQGGMVAHTFQATLVERREALTTCFETPLVLPTSEKW
jgi:hypothetical protein